MIVMKSWATRGAMATATVAAPARVPDMTCRKTAFSAAFIPRPTAYTARLPVRAPTIFSASRTPANAATRATPSSRTAAYRRAACASAWSDTTSGSTTHTAAATTTARSSISPTTIRYARRSSGNTRSDCPAPSARASRAVNTSMKPAKNARSSDTTDSPRPTAATCTNPNGATIAVSMTLNPTESSPRPSIIRPKEANERGVSSVCSPGPSLMQPALSNRAATRYRYRAFLQLLD